MNRFLFDSIRRLVTATVTVAVTLMAGSFAHAQPLKNNPNLDIRKILHRSGSRKFTLVRPQVLAGRTYAPVYVGSGTTAAETAAQAICSLYYPGLVAIGRGLAQSASASVKLNEWGTPLARVHAQPLERGYDGAPLGGATVISFVTCAAEK